MGDHKPARAPTGLGVEGRRLWRSVTGQLELRGDELGLLEHAARTADELATLQGELAASPALVEGSMGQPKPNPLFAEIRAHRDTLRRLLGQLDIPDDESDDDDQPLSNSQRAALRRWRNHREDQQRGASA